MAGGRRNKTIHFTEEGRRQAQQILSRVHHSEQTAMAGLTVAEPGAAVVADQTLYHRLQRVYESAVTAFGEPFVTCQPSKLLDLMR